VVANTEGTVENEFIQYLREPRIIEWLSKMNVKHEYVKLHEIIPGVQEKTRRISDWLTRSMYFVRTEPVPEVPVRTAVSQYPLLFGGWFTRLDKVYTRELYSVAVRRSYARCSCTEICGVLPTKNQSWKKPLTYVIGKS